MRLLKWILAFAVVSSGVFAQATFLPPNDLDKQDLILGLDRTTMTEKQFNQVIDKVYAAMEPSVALHGAGLEVERLWNDHTVNAMSKQHGNTWVVYMYGGLARRPEITMDGFTLVMCHEMGHHLGGYPFYPLMGRWAAAEGQADYFATEVCARKVWGQDKVENAKSRFDVPSFVKEKCDGIWKDQDEQNLCYRTAAASLSLGTMLNTLKGGTAPRFDTPDRSQVSRTMASYPSTQCRLDTYFSGALCTARFDLSVIPGRHRFGLQGGMTSEREAAPYACTRSGGYSVGVRPACWYRDRL